MQVIDIPHDQSDANELLAMCMDETSVRDHFEDLTHKVIDEVEAIERLRGESHLVADK